MALERAKGPDFEKIFASLPGCYLILSPDAPRFTIIAASDDFYRITGSSPSDVMGKSVFEAFPDNPSDRNATGVKNLTISLNKVLKNRAKDTMLVQKYDIPIRGSVAGDFQERYWIPENSPVLDEKGEVLYIINFAIDVTEHEKLLRIYGAGADARGGEPSSKTQAERLAKLMIDRELRMAELKKEMEVLRKKAEVQ